MADTERRTWRALHNGRWYRMWREPGNRRVLRQLEHRWVWEQANGPIPDGFHVHHINHDRTDNRLENLQALQGAEHRRHHARDREDHRIINGVELRSCQRCHVYKPLAEFSARAAGTRHGYCAVCGREYLRNWKRTNAAAKEWRRVYYETVERPKRLAEHEYTRGPYSRSK